MSKILNIADVQDKMSTAMSLQKTLVAKRMTYLEVVNAATSHRHIATLRVIKNNILKNISKRLVYYQERPKACSVELVDVTWLVAMSRAGHLLGMSFCAK